MFIKLFIICMFIPLIIIDANDSRNYVEKPILENVTRGGKFLGLFPVPKRPIFPLYLTKNKNWRGTLIFSLGGFPLIATSVEYNHVHTKDPYCFFCLQHPQQINTLVNQFAHQQPPEYLGNYGITNVNDGNQHPSSIPQYDPLNSSAELPLNTSSISVSATASLMTTKPNASTMRTQETLRTLKLEDYDAITFDPNSENDIKDVDESREDDDEDENTLNRVRREIQDLRQESNDEMESTTVESSTSVEMTTILQEDNLGTSIASVLEVRQKPSQDFIATTATPNNKHPSYAASVYPNAQFISIAHEPQNSYGYLPQIQQPVKNYYNFYPSQPDYSYYYKHNSFVPYCYANYGHNKFMPSNYYNEWANSGLQHNYLRK